MSTKIYGASDDLIEFEGDVNGEVGAWDASEKRPANVACSDGTILKFLYAPDDAAIWKIAVIERGSLFDHLEICTDENANPYSDIACFSDGLKYAYVTRGECERAE